MEDKKKHLFIKMAFLLLFVLLNLLGFCSTCLAITPISEFSTEDYRAVLEKFYDNWYYNTNPSYKNYLRNVLDNPTTFQDTFTAVKNNLISSDIQYIEQIMITSSGYSIWFSPNNNTIGNSLPLVYVTQGSYDANYNQINLSFLDDGNYSVFPKIVRLFLEVPSSDITTSSNHLEFRFSKNYPTTADDLSDTCFIPGVYSIRRAGSYHLSIQNITTGWYWGNDDTIINKTVIPPAPSGDISGDVSGETGVITNPSGEIIGNIDLSGIEDGIDKVNENLENIENKIPSSGDIQEVIAHSNESYWGGSGELTGDDQEDEIEDGLNEIIDTISGELTSNAVFQHLESVENVFLGFLKNKQNESFYDLIISWNDISVFGGTIVEANSINISQMCRDIPELALIQNYIRIIFNFSCLFALLWQIYNLILSTLGIDNPYLYEDADVTDVINSDTGEVRTYYKTRKRFYRRF